MFAILEVLGGAAAGFLQRTPGGPTSPADSGLQTAEVAFERVDAGSIRLRITLGFASAAGVGQGGSMRTPD